MDELIPQYPKGGVIPFPIQGTGQETRSFCYIDDCTAQLSLLAGQGTPGGVYHVGTMDERTVADVAVAVGRRYGREVKVMPGKLAKGSPPRRLPDTAKIRALGTWPETSFEDGLAETAAWYQAHSLLPRQAW
jgi:nucleoside-diphosphate-sugar epimerase